MSAQNPPQTPSQAASQAPASAAPPSPPPPATEAVWPPAGAPAAEEAAPAPESAPLPPELPKPKRWAVLKDQAGELLRSLWHEDRPTRRAALLFFASCFGVVFVLFLAAERIVDLRRASKEQLKMAEIEKARLADLANWQEALVKQTARTLDLGRFLIELRPGKKEADFDLAVVFKTVEVREYVEARPTQAKNEIIEAMQGVKATDFSSMNGRNMIRTRLVDRMNFWIAKEFPGGKVDDIYFTNLLVN